MFSKLENKLDNLEFRIKELEINQKNILDDYKKKNIQSQWVLNNWWKITAIALPILIMLGEISIYIRKLV